jgi:hypothetical protein
MTWREILWFLLGGIVGIVLEWVACIGSGH